MTRRLIEEWLPIAALGIESLRERTPMTPFPAPNRLHVWWARRPLVASRAAVLASLLPADANHDAFLHALGIHGDPVDAKRRIAIADRNGERLGKNAYGYPRAFGYLPDLPALEEAGLPMDAVVLDPTAGGGSIPFEASRLGLHVYANDLNPVAALILKATVDLPQRYGNELLEDFIAVGREFRRRMREALVDAFPEEPEEDTRPDGYLWARTATCPHCDGLVPLFLRTPKSPRWKLAPDGTGVRLIPQVQDGPGSQGRVCQFEVVTRAEDQSEGTVSGGDAACPYPDCNRVIEGEEIKRQAQAGEMGEQLYTVVYKRRTQRRLKSGKLGKPSWKRGYRAPRPEDDNRAEIFDRLAEKLPEWEALDIIPAEEIPEGNKTDEPRRHGMTRWRDIFSPRQLLGHGLAAEVYRCLVEEDQSSGKLNEVRVATYIYLALSLDKIRDYNSRMTRWHSTRETMVNTFDSHDFSLKWAYAEMAIMIEGLGYDWAIEQTAKCIRELITLTTHDQLQNEPLFGHNAPPAEPKINLSLKPGQSLDHIEDGSVDAVVIDPPYGANVMYAELSDFFYVWLKRTAGLVAPEFFTRRLTDKDVEAVANKAHFKGQKGADARATLDYQHKMAEVFGECRRVLKDDGIMTVMFTHKEAGAWDALTMGLIEAGFVVTASWPINTEAEGSLHIKDKAAANSTIFLVCRPRVAAESDETTYWEDVEPEVERAVRRRIAEFQEAGISGVDLYLASFGPALEAFSRHWPLKRGTPRPEDPASARKRKRQAELFPGEFDPYAATPEDALLAARRVVKNWRLDQLTHMGQNINFDPATSWFILAWDAFKAPKFAYDEGLRLARAVGADLEGQIIGRLCAKKNADLILWDSATRAAKNAMGSPDGSVAMIDALHHAAHSARTRSVASAEELVKGVGLRGDPTFLKAFEALLEVLPPSRSFVGFDVATGDSKASADDFDALEKLRRVAFAEEVDEPYQLALFKEEAEGVE